MQASELAKRVNGTLSGPDRPFVGVAPLSAAQEDQVAYAEGALPPGCRAGVLLIRSAIPGRCCVVVEDPKLAFIQLLRLLFPEVHPSGVQPGAWVHPDATLEAGVVVYPGVVVGADCWVGAETVLFPNVVLYPKTRVGRNCRIHAGVVLGADGFSYHATPQGVVKVPQVGNVVVGDGVEIGANSTIDRAFLTSTKIGSGACLDNLVHVGHNTEVGRHSVIAAQTGISGSVTIGDGVVMGGQVGVADHATIGPGARLGAGAGVHGTIPAGEAWLGRPAVPVRLARRIMVIRNHLPEMWAWFRKHKREQGD